MEDVKGRRRTNKTFFSRNIYNTIRLIGARVQEGGTIIGLPRNTVARGNPITHARTTTTPISSTTSANLFLFLIKRLKPLRVNILSTVNSQQLSLFVTAKSIRNTQTITNNNTAISSPFLTKHYKKKYKVKDLTLFNSKGLLIKK